jgi:hypothetical protein
MTERRPPRRPRRPGLLAVGTWSLAAFVAVLVLLVVQMRVGRDPALGARPATAVVAPAPRRVLLRRVIVKRVVVDEVHDAEDGAASAARRTVVVVPQPSAPAVAPAPAPAPAPARLVTKTS